MSFGFWWDIKMNEKESLILRNYEPIIKNDINVYNWIGYMRCDIYTILIVLDITNLWMKIKYNYKLFPNLYVLYCCY